MLSTRIIHLVAAGLFLLPILGHSASKIAPVPSDPLELATGDVQSADTPTSRQAALDLLGRAQENYALRAAGRSYDLKSTFSVNSGGETEYDGAWQMEDTFDPQQGLHWTATATGGYTITEISAHGNLYADGTLDHIPLRLHEARAALFAAIPPAAALKRAVIRTSTAVFQGAQVTCILVSPPKHASVATPGRSWEETEDCIDQQSGLLKLHSQVPGRYYAYDYSNALQFAGHTFPGKVVVTEGGKTVSDISIERLEPLFMVDPSLFTPTAEMNRRGRAIAMAGAQKIWRVVQNPSAPVGAAAHAVCVFGLITPSGQLVEAHSLQPSDPYSQAAIEEAKAMTFSRPSMPGQLGTLPRQHFVFIIEKFVSP